MYKTKKNYKIYSYINKEPQLMTVKIWRRERERERKSPYAKYLLKKEFAMPKKVRTDFSHENLCIIGKFT